VRGNLGFPARIGALINGDKAANMTTFGLRTECMLSYGSKLWSNSLNPLLQDLRGKSGLISEKI
jgi:hypothetical protein